MHTNGSYRWFHLNFLDRIAEKLNNTVRRSTTMAPSAIRQEHVDDILDLRARRDVITFPQPGTKKQPEFRVGDRVRLSKLRNVFEKSHEMSYTTEIFIVTGVYFSNIFYYKVSTLDGNELEGSFTKNELKKTFDPNFQLVEKILRKKGDRVFVKYWGIPEEKGEWLLKDDVFDVRI